MPDIKTKGFFWSIRWKIILIATLIFSLIFLSIFYWFYSVSTNLALENLYSNMISVGRFAANGIDADLHQALYENPDYDPSQEWPKGMEDARYWEISEWLFTVHRSNPRAFLYTYVSPTPGVIEFVVSHGAVLSPVEGASFGYPYTPNDPSVILNGLVEETVSRNVIDDQWGSWVSGFIPLYNSENEIIAAVGVDYRADDITEIQEELKDAALPAFFLSYFILLAVVIYFSNRSVEPVISLSRAANQIGEGELAIVAQKSRMFRDEISTLTDVFNNMAEKVWARRDYTLALYQDNIQRHEQERIKLAHDLHDEVLNGLAALSMVIDDEYVQPQFQKDYQKLTFRIRQIINGLRPPMLDHGLFPALEALVDELSDRPSHETIIKLDLGLSDERYESSLEGHLFRIVQQACENALQHANATELEIAGELGKDRIQLIIKDNGIGFSPNETMARARKMDHRHFGLVVMQERAELINAELIIDSMPGEGTKVEILLSDVLQSQWEYRARIRAEEALRDSELTARGLMNATLDIIFLVDNDGIILDANKALANRFNKRVEDIIGVCAWDLIPPHLSTKRRAFFDQVLRTGRPIRFEDERLDTWFDNYMYPIANDKGMITKVAIFARDLTLRKILEEALHESIENSQTLLNATSDLIALTTLDGMIIDANKAMAQRFNRSVEELVDRYVWDLFPSNVAKHRRAFGERVIQTGEPVQFEDQNRGLRFSNTLYPIKDVDGKVIKFAVFVREIGE